jgi:predicted ATPase
MDRKALEREMLDAHARHDAKALVRLYTIAGDDAELQQDIDAAFFYLTHAFVFALESGAPEARDLNRRLADRGRATKLEL